MRKFASIFIFIVILVFVSGCIQNFNFRLGSESQIEPQFNVSFSTDKYVYHSGEILTMNISTINGEKYDNVTIKIYGIKDSRGNFRIYYEKNISLKDKPYMNITFQMPSCYGCAGVSPGNYEVNLQILYNGNVIGSYNKTITLER